MRVTVDEARAFFAHPSQQLMMVPDDLPDGLEYWADGPICGVFHLSFWPGVWMAHYGVNPDGWGRLVPHAKAILREFWDYQKPDRIIGWTEEKNRLALAFSRRLGFVIDGRMELPGGAIIMQGLTL